MEKRIDRKEFLRSGAGLTLATVCLSGSSVLLQSCSNVAEGTTDRGLRFRSLEEADHEIENLSRAGKVLPYGDWSPFQVLVHCAESIRYSIVGYPENKSKLFQSTLGKFALLSFSIRGKMSHDLNAPIPGAPELPKQGTLEEGVANLRKAMESFINHKGEFAPHFAYGKLSKEEYEMAHAMHIANHLSYLKISG